MAPTRITLACASRNLTVAYDLPDPSRTFDKFVVRHILLGLIWLEIAKLLEQWSQGSHDGAILGQVCATGRHELYMRRPYWGRSFLERGLLSSAGLRSDGT